MLVRFEAVGVALSGPETKCILLSFVQGAVEITPLLEKVIKTKPFKIGHFDFY